MTTRSIQYCLFDMDGLLLDTERIYSEVTQTIVGRYGKTYDWSLKAQMMGMKAHDAAVFLVQALSLPYIQLNSYYVCATPLPVVCSITAEEYLSERNAMQEVRFPSARPLPGALRLVRHLKNSNVPIAVATSSNTRAFQIKSQHNQELFSLFDAVVCGDDAEVQRGKPHPDIFQVAAARLRCPHPRQCLVFEDAPAGVRAAQAADMHVVWVPDSNLDRAEVQADLVLPSLLEFDPASWGLPPF